MIRNGITYDITGQNLHTGSVVDSIGNRYTYVDFSGSILIDSIGEPILIEGISNFINCKQNIAVIKFDSKNNYLFHYVISMYRKYSCELRYNLRVIPSNYNEHSILLTVSNYDSIDVVDKGKNLFKRFRMPSSADSTIILIGSVSISGSCKWMNSISRITKDTVKWPYPGGSKNFSNPKYSKSGMDITLGFDSTLTADIELSNMALSIDDSLQIEYSNNSFEYVKTNNKDIQITFLNDGKTRKCNNILSLTNNNTADNIEILNSLSDGVFRYSLIKLVLPQKDSLQGQGKMKFDVGNTIIIIKQDKEGNLVWVRKIGNGIFANTFMDIDKLKGDIIIGFNFDYYNFKIQDPVYNLPSNSWKIYLIKIDTSSSLIWNQTILFSPNNITSQGIGLSVNPLDHGFIIIGSVTNNYGDTTEVFVGTKKLEFNSKKSRVFLLQFDSDNTCEWIEGVVTKNYNPGGTVISIGEDRINSRILSNPFMDAKGNASITGIKRESGEINLSCNRKLIFDKGKIFVLNVNSLPKKYVKSCGSYLSPSEKYLWDSSGNYIDTIQTKDGCDSIIRVSLEIQNTKSQIDTSFCGTFISPSGKYKIHTDSVFFDTIINSRLCDSVIYCKVKSLKTANYLDTIFCTSFLSPSGKKRIDCDSLFYDTIPNLNGCDSVILINAKRKFIYAKIDTNVCIPFHSPSGHYFWNKSGMYNDTISSFNGCDSVIVFNINFGVTYSILNLTSCNDLVSPSLKYIYNKSGTFQDTVMNSVGCDSVITINFDKKIFQVNVSKSNDISCHERQSQLLATEGKSYVWEPSDYLFNNTTRMPTASPPYTMKYKVTVQDSLGCLSSDSLILYVDIVDSIQNMPNVFTPNSDGFNDKICLNQIWELVNVNFSVYNRYGDQVFHTYDPYSCWFGENLSQGVYFYTIDGTTVCGTMIKKSGTITLIK